PISTPVPNQQRKLVSDILKDQVQAKSVGKGGEGEEERTSPDVLGYISNKTTSFKQLSTVKLKGGSFTTYEHQEKATYARHINSYLKGDPFLGHLLPLDADGNDLFEKCVDGILLCRMVCLAAPEAIADAKINHVREGGKELSVYQATENLNVALEAAKAAGVSLTNMGAEDIMLKRSSHTLSMLWQLIRLHLLAQLNLKHCPDLIHLMKEGEEEEDFAMLPVEDLLLRWVNHHLEWGGSGCRVTNFSKDLSDGHCYMALLK
ncbi:unnamed protein product, partial [Discosporangium mesarthrocarpum]